MVKYSYPEKEGIIAMQHRMGLQNMQTLSIKRTAASVRRGAVCFYLQKSGPLRRHKAEDALCIMFGRSPPRRHTSKEGSGTLFINRKDLRMNRNMKLYVISLLETYSKREQQIDLLHYEMRHTARVSSEEIIDGMSLGHGDGMGGSKGHIFNKTMYIALNYQEKMEHMNEESANEIAECLLKLETEQNRLRHYVSLLEKREAEVLRSFYFEGCSLEETAKRIGVVLRSAYKIKNKTISHLTELYAFKTGLG